jgi:hypothetical protein
MTEDLETRYDMLSVAFTEEVRMNTAHTQEIAALKAELLLLKTERELELMTNTKAFFTGTHVMELNRKLEAEHKKLLESLKGCCGHCECACLDCDRCGDSKE